MLTRRTLLATTAALAASPASSPAGAQTSSSLAIGVVSDPVTLDPAFSASFFETQVMYNLHETLLVARPDGTIAPGLAREFGWKDPTTYALTLRDGMTFQDGAPIDAEACKANVERYVDPAGGSIRRPEFGPLREVAVTGKLTFELRLTEAYSPLPLVLTNRAGMMVSPAAVRALGADFATRAVGAGPWKFLSWTKNSELVLERFPGYWQGDKQPFDKLVYRPLPDETARLANLRSGTLQLIDSVPPQAVAGLGREAALRVSSMPSLGFNAFSFNTTRPPFDDARVRRAFTMAVDPSVMQQVVFFGTGAVSHGPLSPAVAWAYDKGIAGLPHDPAKAAALLKEAGRTAPVPVGITVTNSPQMVRIAQILQAQAAPGGFAVEIKQIDPTSLITVLRGRDFDLCMSPWSGRYDPDGNTFNYFSKGGANNFAGWSDDAVDGWLRQARRETAEAARAALYKQIQDRIVAEAPMLFIHFDAILQASTAKLQWTQYPDGAFRLYDARLG